MQFLFADDDTLDWRLACTPSLLCLWNHYCELCFCCPMLSVIFICCKVIPKDNEWLQLQAQLTNQLQIHTSNTKHTSARIPNEESATQGLRQRFASKCETKICHFLQASLLVLTWRVCKASRCDTSEWNESTNVSAQQPKWKMCSTHEI